MLCIIPAKGTSKRLPRKNLLPVNGKPLFYHAAAAARDSAVFTKILISTEDAEIKTEARRLGFAVDDRPPTLSSDRATCAEVCQDILLRTPCDRFACIYATAALLKPEHIRQAAAKLDEYFSVIGVTKFEIHPWKALDENFEPLMPEYVKRPLNNAPLCYGSNGSLYMAHRKEFLKNPDFYHGMTGIETPSIDVDTQQDFDKLKNLVTTTLDSTEAAASDLDPTFTGNLVG